MKPSYGMYFTVNPATYVSVNNKQFAYFTDIPMVGTSTGDKLYGSSNIANNLCNSGSSPECLSVTQINSGEYIDEICYPTPSVVCDAKELNIVYTRPLPDASILMRTAYNSTTSTVLVACIEIASPNDASSKRTIKVNSFGQIQTYNLSATSTVSGTNICS